MNKYCKSLFMLGRVINELTTGAEHISYRDSCLTRILQPALGGNAKTGKIPFLFYMYPRGSMLMFRDPLKFRNGLAC